MNLTLINDKSKKQLQVNIYHYDAQLAIAFQADCDNLLQKLKLHQSCSYSVFAELWRETCFSAIFKGQECILMLQTYLENCFFIAKKFLFVPDPYIQTGALYILYALYYKQPIKKWIRIRLTQTEADKLNEIAEIHKANNSYDVVFIYSKMRLDGAFQYCALVQPLGLEARFLRRYDLAGEEINAINERNGPLQKFKNLMEEDPDLVQFEEIDDEYQKLANKYKEKCGKLFVFPSKIGEDLKKAYSDVFHIDLGDNEQDRVKEAKTRAMLNTNAVYRGEKQVLTALDLATPSTSK